MKTIGILFLVINITAINAQIPEGFTKIFNESDFTGWTVKGDDVAKWSIEGNTLGAEQTDKGRGWLQYETMFTDFEFYCEWKVSESANSGIFIHVPNVPCDPTWDAIELQICDENNYPIFYKKEGYVDGDIRETNGAIYGIVGATKKVFKGKDQWNSYLITVKGDSVILVFNGEKVLAIDRNDYPNSFNMWNEVRKPLTERYEEGYLGIQAHKGAKSWFRNIAVKELNSTAIQNPKEPVLSAYPNPVSETLYVSNSEMNRNVEFFNAQGELCVCTSNKTLDVSSFPSGLYILKTNALNGTSSAHKIIVN